MSNQCAIQRLATEPLSQIPRSGQLSRGTGCSESQIGKISYGASLVIDSPVSVQHAHIQVRCGVVFFSFVPEMVFLDQRSRLLNHFPTSPIAAASPIQAWKSG